MDSLNVRKPHHRQITLNQYNLLDYDATRTDGKYNIPMLEPVDHVPSKLQGFNYVLNKPDHEACVHFFLDDYQFERIWKRPDFYIDKLAAFDSVITPEFSLYIDMPLAMQLWNTYRTRMIGQIMQNWGLTVIPSVTWSYEDSYDFCFDGLPKFSTLAVETLGVKKNKWQTEIWKNGMDELIKRKQPKRLLIYGGKIDYDFPDDIEVIHFSNAVTDRLEERKKG